MDPKQFDDMARSVMDSLPKGFQSLQADVEKNMQSALQATFAKMNLVTREEFDIQAKLLNRTREKLDLLEAQIAELEKHQTDSSKT